MKLSEFFKLHNCTYEEIEDLITHLLAIRLRNNIKINMDFTVENNIYVI